MYITQLHLHKFKNRHNNPVMKKKKALVFVPGVREISGREQKETSQNDCKDMHLDGGMAPGGACLSKLTNVCSSDLYLGLWHLSKNT